MRLVRLTISALAGWSLGAQAAPPTRAETDWAAGYAKTITRYCPNWSLVDEERARALGLTSSDDQRIPGIPPALWEGVTSAAVRHGNRGFCADPVRAFPTHAALTTRFLRPSTAEESARWLAWRRSHGDVLPEPRPFSSRTAPEGWASGFAVVVSARCPEWRIRVDPTTAHSLLPIENPTAQWEGGMAAASAFTKRGEDFCHDPLTEAGDYAKLVKARLGTASGG